MDHPPRFVILDDEESVRRMMASILKQAFPGCTITEITDEQALDTLIEQEQFDCAITDYHSGWIDGLTVLRKIKTACPDCPVIMFTGSGSEELLIEAMHAGLDDYVLKSPPQDRRLVPAVQRALDRARETRQRKQAESEVIKTSARERQRIGQDLHDSLGQLLFGISLMAEDLENTIKQKIPEDLPAAGRLRRQIEAALGHAHQLVEGLCPVKLENGGLAAALRELAEHVCSLNHVSCRFQGPDGLTFNDTAAATHLYRIAQEAAANAVKHAHSKNILIKLGCDDGTLSLSIEDDGTGMKTLDNGNECLGLAIMRYRAKAIGASLNISPRPAGGTTVTCRLPM